MCIRDRGYPKPFKNKVRTFCQNPGGFVSQENYDNNLAVVNGHSYKAVSYTHLDVYKRQAVRRGPLRLLQGGLGRVL